MIHKKIDYESNFHKKIKIDDIWHNNDKKLINLEEHLMRYIKDDKSMFFYLYKPKSMSIDFDELSIFMSFFHTIPTKSDGTNLLPVCIDLQNITFSDKLIYVMFETILYHLISDKGWSVTINGIFKAENCSNNIHVSSLAEGNWPLTLLGEANFDEKIKPLNIIRERKYKYNRREDDNLSSTRYLVNNTAESSVISSDIFEFLENSLVLKDVDSSTINRIASTIIEIKDNCAEHTQFPYVYDIDIKKVTHGELSPLNGKAYVAINVAIWDFSGIKLGDAIKKKLQIIESPDCTEEELSEQIGKKIKPFERLLKAKGKHALFWDCNYDEDDFFAISAFQPGITGRANPGSTGGAGLSHVLDFLCDFPDAYRGYCLTGNTIINFDRKYLNKDAEMWYSFIEEKNLDFVNNKPNKKSVSKSKFFYPGTAFFLHLELNGGK